MLLSLFVLLISVGTAQAGERPTWPIIVQDTSGNELIRCDESGQACTIQDPNKFPCYKRIQEALQKMKDQMHLNPNSRSLSRGFVMTQEAWEREFEPIYRECVK